MQNENYLFFHCAQQHLQHWASCGSSAAPWLTDQQLAMQGTVPAVDIYIYIYDLMLWDQIKWFTKTPTLTVVCCKALKKQCGKRTGTLNILTEHSVSACTCYKTASKSTRHSSVCKYASLPLPQEAQSWGNWLLSNYPPPTYTHNSRGCHLATLIMWLTSTLFKTSLHTLPNMYFELNSPESSVPLAGPSLGLRR